MTFHTYKINTITLHDALLLERRYKRLLYFTIGLALFFSMSGIVLSNNNHMDDKGKYYLFGLLLVLAIHYYHKAKQFGIHAFYLDTTDVKCNNQQSCIDFNKSAQQVDAPEPASPAG